MKINVRTAREEDINFLSWVMFTAAKSHLEKCVWETLLDMTPDEVTQFLKRVAVSENTHWCHYTKFLIAEVEGKHAGALCTFDPVAEGTAALSDTILGVAAELGFDDNWINGVLERVILIDAATPKDYPDTWGIENVAVRPEFRGRGIVEALFEHAMRIARASEHEHAQILCLNGNIRAQRAWERQGFELRADYQSNAFQKVFGCPGLKLLAQKL